MRWKDFKIARERMVREQVFDRGIRDRRVLAAMLKVPRHVFLDRDAGSEAYNDHSFPIGFQQTMSQPHTVALLTQALKLTGEERVLEIGTGSGYQAAVLATLADSVFTIERLAGLASKASRALQDLLYTNVRVKVGDGALGWPEAAPFDRILMTAASRQVPKALLMQLVDRGTLVGPIVKEDETQELIRLTRKGNAFSLERLSECSFVRLIRERGVAPVASQLSSDSYGA